MLPLWNIPAASKISQKSLPSLSGIVWSICLRRSGKPIEEYLAELELPPDIEPEAFVWEPKNKGRTRYCDIVAIDMICKINQGIYPLGTLLPGGPVLADTYHVSEITIRRTIGLLNTLGVVQTINSA